MGEQMDPPPELPTVIDTTVAHPARVYDAMIGGKDNYAADRELAESMTEQLPDLPLMLRANRDFLGHAVRFLVGERGITQFLDIGSGMPTGQNVHEVAQAIDPSARVVYVDNDPVVLAHARALLLSGPEGRTAYIHADASDPEALLADPVVFTTLDRTRPTALLLNSVLMYFPDALAHRIVATVLDALPAGSHLVISHPANDFDPAASARSRDAGRAGGIDYYPRDHAGVTAFFAGLQLLDPGVVPLLAWKSEAIIGDPKRVHYWVGLATKPGPSS